MTPRERAALCRVRWAAERLAAAESLVRSARDALVPVVGAIDATDACARVARLIVRDRLALVALAGGAPPLLDHAPDRHEARYGGPTSENESARGLTDGQAFDRWASGVPGAAHPGVVHVQGLALEAAARREGGR